jgi:KipI family sensor histidine kinase inhibitor
MAIEITDFGDSGLLLRWPQRIDASINAQVQELAASLQAAPIQGVSDVVPAYASLALLVDPRWLTQAGQDPRSLIAQLETRIAALAPGDAKSARHIHIPICYGGDFGPDLDEVAAFCGLLAAEVVRRHAAAEYRVAMLGFQPGFPYLLGLDPRLAMPRLAAPRVRVPAGSVAIGGAQTGIYPRESPGGWRLIGRTSAVLFDEKSASPTLLLPGDRVTFCPVDAATFAARTEPR